MARPPLDQLRPRRVLLVKPSALGDVVQTLPVLAGLRRRWPDAHLAWVVNDAFAGLLAGHPDLDQVIPFPRRKGWSTVPALLRQVRGFDLAIDLQGLFRSAALTWFAAPRRLGFRHSREGAWLAYTDLLDTPVKQTPAVLANWSAAVALGCEGPPPLARLGLTAAHQADAARLLAGLPRPLIAIHPGASWLTKRWPSAHFAALAQLARQRVGAGVVVVGGPGEEMIAAAVASQLPGCLDLCGKTDLLGLAAVLRAADVMLCNDSGPMHLAAAVGTRVVAPFTCTSPLRAGPHGEGHAAVATTVSCAASYRRSCATLHCMQDLTPPRLWPALEGALVAAGAA
jgi:heptosyltransferase-1